MGGFAYSVGLTGKHVPKLLLDNSKTRTRPCPPLNDEPFGPRALRLHRIYSASSLDTCALAGALGVRLKAMPQFTAMQLVFPVARSHFPK